MSRARRGDAGAFAIAFEALRPKVFAVACRLVGPDAADDVVMETYLKAWRNLPRFRGTARLSTWLYRITRNCALDHLRRRQRAPEVSADAPDATGRPWLDALPDPRAARPAESIEAAERAERVQSALARLPEIHRAILLLRYADDLAYGEVAAAAGVSIGTVMSRLFHAKRKLKALLENA